MGGWVTQQDIDDIRSFGVAVVEQPGWRVKSDSALSIEGFMLHHDAMALGLDSNPNNDYNVPAYMGTPGNLGSQLWAATGGTVVVMAAGGKGHAGTGQWRDIPANRGNSYCCALETDHTDGTGWSDHLMYSIDVVSYVITKNHGVNVDRAMCGHKEYAPNRKHDPSEFDCNAWRERIKSGKLWKRLDVPPPPTEPEIKEEEMAVALTKDKDTGWIYGIAPGFFQNIPEADENGVNQLKTGDDLGLWDSSKILVLNWIQIKNMAHMMAAPNPDAVYVPNSDGSPGFQ